MSKDHEGTSALSGLIAFLMITSLLSTDAVAMYRGVDVSEVPDSFGKISNAFIGILSGVIGASSYNRFKGTILPDWLAFFSGKRSVAIVTACTSILVAVLLYFIWPLIYAGLVAFGTSILGLGALGAGLYAMLNRALIPLGIHHALNTVFWFDTANINDLGLFWSGADGAVKGVTGQYMTGFFPIMMFGLPAGALAMYHTAKTSEKKKAAAFLLAGAFASFFTGITEPLEFSFMFMAPGLYLVHAVLTGISVAVCASMPFRIGFNFSAISNYESNSRGVSAEMLTQLSHLFHVSADYILNGDSPDNLDPIVNEAIEILNNLKTDKAKQSALEVLRQIQILEG